MTNNVFSERKRTRSLSEFEFLHDPNDKASKLGIGSFACVKLAKDKKTGRPYALKMIILDPTKVSDSDLHNIRTEVAIHRKISHPNIVKFHDYIIKDCNVYLILDYVEGGNLYGYLHRRKELPQSDIFRFFHQTCLAVQYLHDNDIMHRDLKPENMLIDAKLNIKLCDFGWSTQRITEKRTTFCGTYEYMAPEIISKRPYDYRVDIWSLGVLLYELIHHEAPYKGRTHAEVAKSMLKMEITYSPVINPEAKDLIQKILKHDPEERLPIASILSHPWVKSFLPRERSIEEFSYREKSIPSQSSLIHSASVESYKIRRGKEPFKSQVLKITEDGMFNHAMSPRSRKRSPINLFGSLSGISESITNRRKETERSREREATNENLLTNFTTDTTVLNYSEIQRKKMSHEFSSSFLPKTPESTTTKARTKSIMPLASYIVNKPVLQDQGKTPKSLTRSRNSKVFENNIVSPSSQSLKTKVNDIIQHLSSQTTRLRMPSDVSNLFPSKDLSQQSSRSNQGVPKSSSRTNRLQIQGPKLECEPKTVSRGKSENKPEDNCQFSTSCSSTNTSKIRCDTEQKRRNALHYAKANMQPKMVLSKGEDFYTLPSSAPKTTRSMIKTRTDAKSPEPGSDSKINILASLNKMPITTRAVRSPVNTAAIAPPTERLLSAKNQKTRTKTEENQSHSATLNNFFRTLDTSKKKGSTFFAELSSINQKAQALKEQKGQKAVKKDSLKEKENYSLLQTGRPRSRMVQ